MLLHNSRRLYILLQVAGCFPFSGEERIVLFLVAFIEVCIYIGSIECNLSVFSCTYILRVPYSTSSLVRSLKSLFVPTTGLKSLLLTIIILSILTFSLSAEAIFEYIAKASVVVGFFPCRNSVYPDCRLSALHWLKLYGNIPICYMSDFQP